MRQVLPPIVHLNNEMLDFLTNSFEQDQGVLATLRVKEEVVLMNGEGLLPIPIFKSVQIQLCATTCCGEKRFTSLESSVFWFLCRT